MKVSKALSFITLMVIIALFSLLLRFAIKQIIKINIAQNESYAQEALKLISTALENYAKDNLENYPESLLALVQSNPS